MASELAIPQKFTYAKGQVKIAWTPAVNAVTVSGTDAVYKTQSIATTDTTVDIGAVSSIGWVIMQNQDVTNFVTVGDDGTHYQIKLLPGEPPVILRFNGAAIHAKADTASCQILYAVLSQ